MSAFETLHKGFPYVDLCNQGQFCGNRLKSIANEVGIENLQVIDAYIISYSDASEPLTYDMIVTTDAEPSKFRTSAFVLGIPIGMKDLPWTNPAKHINLLREIYDNFKHDLEKIGLFIKEDGESWGESGVVLTDEVIETEDNGEIKKYSVFRMSYMYDYSDSKSNLYTNNSSEDLHSAV